MSIGNNFLFEPQVLAIHHSSLLSMLSSSAEPRSLGIQCSHRPPGNIQYQGGWFFSIPANHRHSPRSLLYSRVSSPLTPHRQTKCRSDLQHRDTAPTRPCGLATQLRLLPHLHTPYKLESLLDICTTQQHSMVARSADMWVPPGLGRWLGRRNYSAAEGNRDQRMNRERNGGLRSGIKRGRRRVGKCRCV